MIISMAKSEGFIKKYGISFFTIVVGAFLASFALDFFLLPYHIAPGGITSASAMLNSALPLSVGIWYAIINVPLFLAGLRLDREFFVKSLLGTSLCTIFIDLLANLDSSVLGIGEDPLLCAIFGGIILGTGYGLVLYAGGSSGGTDIAGWLIRRKHPTIKLGRAILCFDLVIIAVQSFVYGSIHLSLYALIGMFLCSRMIDTLSEGGQAAKVTFIITDQSDAIAARIMEETGRGVTLLRGTGMYTGVGRNVLLCTMYRYNMAHIKKIIREIDPRAFVILSDAREVSGEGFTPLHG